MQNGKHAQFGSLTEQRTAESFEVSQCPKHWLLIEGVSTIGEFAVAIFLILAASSLIYIFGRWLSPKSVHNENEESTYACGEKAISSRLKINVSLYKYLIYFVILDSSVLLVAFAYSALTVTSMTSFMTYLLMVLASVFLLLEGGDQ